MPYADPNTLQLFKYSYNLGVFFRLLPVGGSPIRLSLLANAMPYQLDQTDASGAQYTGCGRLLAVPALETLINGIASTVTFGLNGVDQGLVAEMLDNAPPVLGAPVTVGIGALDARYQPVAGSSPIPIWSGVGDFIGESLGPVTRASQPRVQSLSLTAASGDQSRQLGNNLTYTDATQQLLSPGDTFCQRTPVYYASRLINWPYWS